MLVAATVVTLEFTALYLLGSRVLKLPSLHAAVGAFLVTDFENLAWLVVRKN